jgi:hypothetical protein
MDEDDAVPAELTQGNDQHSADVLARDGGALTVDTRIETPWQRGPRGVRGPP